MLKPTRIRLWMAAMAVMLLAAGCAGAEDEPVETTLTEAPVSEAEEAATPSDDLYVVVTTTILGDVVKGLVGDTGTVEVLLPVGADPHDFQLSSQDGAKLRQADLVVANGLGLEESLAAALESVREDGGRVLEVGDFVDPLEWGAGRDHDDHENEDEDHADEDHADEDHEDEDEDHADEDHEDEDEDHADEDHEDEDEDHADEDHADEDEDHADEDHADEDEDHADEDHADEDEDHADEDHADEDEDHADHDDEDDHGHAHGGAFDPHFWFDPSRVEAAVRVIVAELIEVSSNLSAAEWNERADQQIALIREAAAEAQDILSAVPASQRKLVTNHDSFLYFGEYFGFEILDTILAGGSTLAQPGTAHLANLVETIREEGTKAIFAETTADARLPRTVAAEFDPPLRVVELYTGSLGPAGSGAETYPTWLVTNARLIAEGLTG